MYLDLLELDLFLNRVRRMSIVEQQLAEMAHDPDIQRELKAAAASTNRTGWKRQGD